METVYPPTSTKGPQVGIGIGIFLVLDRLIAPAIPFFSGHSLNQYQGVCNSTLGQLAQAFSQSTSTSCQEVAGYMTVLNVAAIIGIFLVFVCGVTYWRRRQR